MTEVRDDTSAVGAGATDQAKEKAQAAAGEARNRLAVQVDTRSTQAGEQLRSTAGDVRSVGEELRKQGKDKPAELADRAAERVERLGGYLHKSDGDRILRDVEEFGRNNAWAVVGGGLALGIVAGRLLKASSSRRYEESNTRALPSATGPSPAADPYAVPPQRMTPGAP